MGDDDHNDQLIALLRPVVEKFLERADDLTDRQRRAADAAITEAATVGVRMGVGEALGQVRALLAEPGIDYMPTVNYPNLDQAALDAWYEEGLE